MKSLDRLASLNSELMATFRELVKKTPFYPALYRLREVVRRRTIIRQWQTRGCPIPPPPEVKHNTISQYGKRFGLHVLVETGTFYGDTVAATKQDFANVYSIELSTDLYGLAVKRFMNDSRVHLLLGDSGEILKEILPGIGGPSLFWLDAHYSGVPTSRGRTDTPIVREVETILALCPNSVVLIDDARLFNGTNSYPTLAELHKHVRERAPHWVVEIKDDIIRLHPRMA